VSLDGPRAADMAVIPVVAYAYYTLYAYQTIDIRQNAQLREQNSGKIFDFAPKFYRS